MHAGELYGQDILHVSNNPQEEIMRQLQLINPDQNRLTNRSLMVRPLYGMDTNGTKKFSFKLVSLQHLQQVNRKNPLYYNDALMYPTKGWQGYYSFQAVASFKNITFDFKPEYIWASNSNFTGFPSDQYNIVWKSYYEWLNRIDLPQQFNGIPISRASWGQSSLSYNKFGISIGVSNKNMWWGPGRFQSLVLSNHAPGFKHIDLHSQKPLQTPVGSFEWQFIFGGNLLNSNASPPESMRAYNGIFLYVPKDSIHQRSLNGGVIAWQAKWLPGLYLGTDGLMMQYRGVRKATANMGSIFARYALPEDHAEFYVQYGRSDKLATAINLLEDTIPRGFLGGVRKLFPFRTTKPSMDYIQIGIEVLQLGAPNYHLIRGVQSWYLNNTVRHGFTNEGQVLGAAAGAGSNVQKIDVAWIHHKNKIGFEFERWQHNADFYYYHQVDAGSLDFNRHWIDLTASFVGNVHVNKAMIFWNLSGVRTINYYWKSFIPEPVTTDTYFSNGWDFVNVHARLGLIWNINKYIVK